MSLSDDIIDVLGFDVLFVIGVKKAVKELKEKLKKRIDTNTEVRDLEAGTLYEYEVDDIVDEVFGEKLT